VVYPAWPLVSGYTTGVLHYTNRAAVTVDLANLEALRGEKMKVLGTASLAEIEKDPALLALARASGKSAFGDNCAPCHGTGGAGAKGYPNLNDDDWIWGGKLDQIEQTILYGARSGHGKAHEGAMLAFGKDGILKPAEIVTVANYVRSLSGLSTGAGFDAAAGKKIFADNCASCHGDAGKGNQELGAPDLTDKIWLYGSDEATLIETITNGRAGVMPAWAGRLDPATIKALAVYVHSLGGGR
jgi:cytochrome c oxidase cbb3-type subunit III